MLKIVGVAAADSFVSVSVAMRLLLTCLLLAGHHGVLSSSPTKPHIVFFLADDMSWADPSYNRPKSSPYYGYSRTPIMDQLASEGTIVDRMYTHKFCSPSRCAIQSGRAPIHVNVVNAPPEAYNQADPEGGAQGIPRNMTCVAEKMKEGGYATHFVGKWDTGMATPDRTPKGRGYDSSLSYFHHANDYWTYTHDSCVNSDNETQMIYDLWQGGDVDGPAKQLLNGPNCTKDNQFPGAGQRCKFEDTMFAERAMDKINDHDASQPLFLFVSWHTVHGPLEPTDAALAKFSFLPDSSMQQHNSMVNTIDTYMGNITSLLKAKGMWDDTLVVFMSDNGGSLPDGNNFPLKGGKFSNWEGGIRVPSFVSGGFLPDTAPSVTDAAMASWDWYATFCDLAGVEPTDAKAKAAGLPPVDGVSQWPILSGATTTPVRTRVEVGSNARGWDHGRITGNTTVGAIIKQPYKIIVGYGPNDTLSSSVWVSLNMPNATNDHGAGNKALTDTYAPCGRTPETGCLFNVWDDPSEYHNLAASMPDLWTELFKELQAVNETVYSPWRGDASPKACEAALEVGGFWVPFEE